jgi:acyl-CoA synthetase (AMP-forming)/AMP-acid ligase II
VGMPDARWGQIVVAYVSLRAEAKPRPTADELRDFVAQRIAAYKVPVHFFLIDKLPLNASNKIDRKKLHERVVADMQAATCTKG